MGRAGAVETRRRVDESSSVTSGVRKLLRRGIEPVRRPTLGLRLLTSRGLWLVELGAIAMISCSARRACCVSLLLVGIEYLIRYHSAVSAERSGR